MAWPIILGSAFRKIAKRGNEKKFRSEHFEDLAPRVGVSV